MKTFSRLNLFTILLFTLTFVILNIADLHAQQKISLEVVGDKTKRYNVGDEIKVLFAAGEIDAEGQINPARNAVLRITQNPMGYLTDVSTNRRTDAFGELEVTAIAAKKGVVTLRAEWNGQGADATLILDDPGISPAIIAVNPPAPKSPHSVGTTFTQEITIENDGRYSTLPLSAYQMDIVFNPFILEVVNVTEGTFLENDGVDAFWHANIGTGVISVSQARVGQAPNTDPPPANVAKAPSPDGISLSPSEKGNLLTIRFRVLAVAEETLGIHNVRLQSSKDQDKDGTPDRISYAIKILDAFVTTHQQFFAKEDVNQDEWVNIQDLVMVAANIGKYPRHPRTDVNGDGFVNVLDLIAIYQSDNWGRETGKRETRVNEPNDPPALAPLAKGNADPAIIRGWIDLAQNEDDGSVVFDQGIANLKSLLVSKKPTETRLLRNYPNPFNPETWIPYQLAETADVSVKIYSMNGNPIRTLKLGHQSAGTYINKNQAAYWDGRNEFGEQVATGIYFYMLTAGEFSATRKMVILK